MADSKLVDLTNDASPTGDDLIYVVNDPGGSPADRKVTLTNLAASAPFTTAYASVIWNPTPIRKTADESVTSSVALQNDDHLFFAIASSEVWEFQGILFPIGATAGDIKVACTVPSGATGYFGGSGLFTDLTAMQNRTETSFPTGIAFGTDPTTSYPIHVFGYILNSTNAGNVQIQWAQNASSGTATTLKAGSFIAPRRLA